MKYHGIIFYVALGLLGELVQGAVVPASPEINGRIVGGEETTIEAHPYQVSVRLDTYIMLHICGGSIYAPRVIVTAAHCIKGRFASYIYIVAGSSTIADESDIGIRASKLIYNSGYNKATHENDIGLIILTKELLYNSNIQPIALAHSHPEPGTAATITGWGKRDEEAATLTNKLQEAEVHIFDSVECEKMYLMKNYAITEQMICAGANDGGKDTCQGDSGGPLIANGELVGIVSWGIGCARSDYPGVYASIPYHTQWIEENAMPYL